ncbi:MAG: phosphoglycerate mutase family protein [Pseudomonadota bacterium]
MIQSNEAMAARKRRRRRNRILSLVFFATASIGLAWFFESQATTTLIFVRHAEMAVTDEPNPGLSQAGQSRAGELARVLADLDVVAGVDEIYVSQYRRTAETALPLAGVVDVEPRVWDINDTVGEVNRILQAHKGAIVLIIGHGNTIAPMIAELGGSKKVPEIADGEYDNLYIVTIPWFGKVKTLRVKYGEPFRAAN